MKMKYAISASAFVLGAVLASGAMAQQTATSSTGASAANTSTNVSIPGLSNDTIASNNSFTKNVTAHSNNSSTKNVNLTKNVTADSNNTKNVTAHSNNTSTETNTKTVTADSYNTTNVNKTRTTNVNKTYNMRLVHADQDLSGSVTNVSFGGAGSNGHDDNRSLATGAVSWSGGAYQGFGGIQTANVDSGFGSLGQAATMVSANSNVTFGH